VIGVFIPKGPRKKKRVKPRREPVGAHRFQAKTEKCATAVKRLQPPRRVTEGGGGQTGLLGREKEALLALAFRKKGVCSVTEVGQKTKKKLSRVVRARGRTPATSKRKKSVLDMTK